MNWLNAFELMCYTIVAIMLVDLIRKKDYNSLFTFGSATIVGFVMELLAVAVTDIYYYNPNFWLNIGSEPKQFPVFGGFMWGGLTVCGIKLAQKLKLNKVMTALCAGMFIVTMDILLDVVAIRLDGGFWTWVGKPINLDITQHTFMSVIWVNFLGYMIETPTVVWLTLNKREKVAEKDWKKQTSSMVLIALGAILVTAIGSLIALGLNALTDDWFACATFVVLWVSLVTLLVKHCLKQKLRIAKPGRWNYPMLLFWMAMYAYCIVAIIGLGIHVACPWLLVVGIIFATATVLCAMLEDIRMNV
ncbi:MAG: hypothetical protein IJW63_05615 [Lachnospiraceae bacterium]|nr:hypothetical protein [Lachnospiraceae bacterium]